MAAVTIDPSVEACEALVDQINSATVYSIDVAARYSEQLIDPLEEFNGRCLVDVVPEESEQLNETLSVEDRTSHTIRVWVRGKVDGVESYSVAAFKLLTRQIFQRLNDFDSSDNRVRVWECDYQLKETPDKSALKDMGLFVASIVLRVEVEVP